MSIVSTWMIAAAESSEKDFAVMLIWAAAGLIGGLATSIGKHVAQKRSDVGEKPIRLATVGLYGSDQIPVLVDIVKTSKKSAERAAAARELRKFGPQTREAAAALGEAYLASKVSNDAHEFLATLANMGGAAREAIPKLLEGYKRMTVFSHSSLTTCLVKIGPPVGSYLRQVSQTRRLRRPEKHLLRKIEKEHRRIPGSPGVCAGGGMLSMILEKVIPHRLRGRSKSQPNRAIVTKHVAKGATRLQTGASREVQKRKTTDKMRVECPDCQGKFTVSTTAVGRRAKCARCGHTFVLGRDSRISKLATEPAGVA